MKSGNEKSLGEAIEEMLKAYRLKPKLTEIKAIKSWEKLMGQAISSRTREIFIRDRKLFLRLNSSVLKQELVMAREKIINFINEEAGEKIIEEVVFL